jgi:hypothetical protein
MKLLRLKCKRKISYRERVLSPGVTHVEELDLTGPIQQSSLSQSSTVKKQNVSNR